MDVQRDTVDGHESESGDLAFILNDLLVVALPSVHFMVNRPSKFRHLDRSLIYLSLSQTVQFQDNQNFQHFKIFEPSSSLHNRSNHFDLILTDRSC